MRYLLDINIRVLLIRQRSQTVLKKLTRHSFNDIAVSAITVAELQYGVTKSANSIQNQQALDYFLLHLTIMPFDESIAARNGEIRVYLESQGTPIGAIDTLLAAQAISHRLIFVTNNVREFARVPGLTVEDWTLP